jgi:thioredoxin 1
MSTVALTEETFEETVTKEGITLVDWWASWCGPCRMFGPVFEAASETHSDITFGKIDTEDQQGLAGAARITSIPTLMAFRDGVLVFSQAGALPAASLEKLIQAVRDLDMNDVRAELAKQQAGAGGPARLPVGGAGLMALVRRGLLTGASSYQSRRTRRCARRR